MLARQFLLQRERRTALSTVEHLVGMQSQIPLSPYVGLWSRLHDFHPVELVQLITQRKVVRVALLRSTVHLVSARDCLRLRPLVQPAIDRGFRGNHGKRLQGVDYDRLEAVAREMMGVAPRTWGELGAALQAIWPGCDANDLAMAVRTRIAAVQVPPRGVWGAGGLSRHVAAEDWLGRPLRQDTTADQLLLRYLTAFGPATVADMQFWCGLQRLGDVVERLRPRLRSFRDEQQRELLDVRGGTLPDPDTAAPVRFTPEYDNLLLGHADRTRVIAREHRDATFTRGAILVDGYVSASWRVTRRGGVATLEITLFRALQQDERHEVEEEGERLLQFVAADARSRDLRFIA